jgi:hypothetical protein
VDGGNGKSGMDAKGTHFICFTSTKVQILTQPMLGATCHASDATKSAQQFEDFMQAMLVLYGKVLTLPVYSVYSVYSMYSFYCMRAMLVLYGKVSVYLLY